MSMILGVYQTSKYRWLLLQDPRRYRVTIWKAGPPPTPHVKTMWSKDRARLSRRVGAFVNREAA